MLAAKVQIMIPYQILNKEANTLLIITAYTIITSIIAAKRKDHQVSENMSECEDAAKEMSEE